MKSKTQNWLKIARYDLRAAELAFDAELYLTCVEKCHDALEKLLKGLIADQDKQPQKIHDLLRLVTEAVVENLQKDMLEPLGEINLVYMSTRYPDEIDMIERDLNTEMTSKLFKETKRIFSWLEKKLKQN